MGKNTLYYVLLLLLIMGAFASMALNSYGASLINYAALGFGLLFLYELIFVLPRVPSTDPTTEKMTGLELAALLVISLLYFVRGMSIEVPFDTELTGLLTIILWGVNAYFFYRALRSAEGSPLKLKAGLAFYFVSLYLAWIAFYFFTFQNSWGPLFTLIALLCVAGFLVIGGWKGTVMINGEETSALRKVSRFKNKSSLQLIVVLLVVSYYSLSSLNITPPLYIGTLPNGYRKVVNQSKTTTKAGDPKAFEEAYKKFIQGK